jgi:hypothetical protein
MLQLKNASVFCSQLTAGVNIQFPVNIFDMAVERFNRNK